MLNHVYSFENKYQCCPRMALTVTLLTYFLSVETTANEIWTICTVSQTNINISPDEWSFYTFLFLTLQKWLLYHVYSFEIVYQYCPLMALTLTFWPTFLFLKLQQWSLDNVFSSENKYQYCPWMIVTVTFWPSFLFLIYIIKISFQYCLWMTWTMTF